MAEYATPGRVGVPPTIYYSSANIPNAGNNYNGLHWSGLDDTEFDKLLLAAQTELDPNRQRLIWAELQKRYAATLPELPLYFRMDPDVVPVWLKGYDATGKEDYISFYAEKWHG